MMIDWPSIILGCGLGLFAGLVPGLGPFTTLLLAFPLLLDMTITQLLITYSALITVSIYVGSVPATIYGIPGDSASMPVVYESRNLKTLKQVSEAISGAASGGFFGSVVVALFCLWMLDYLDNIKYFYSTPLFLALLIFASVVIIFTSSSNKMAAFMLYSAGFILGLVGYNNHLDMPILVFNHYMYQGLPTDTRLTSGIPLPVIIVVTKEKCVQ
jgi:putative tricarboxylic transport membrane protein